MNCTDAYQALLTADPDELTGHASSELSQHIQRCSRCESRAQVILAQTDAMRRVIGASTPARAAAAALHRTYRRRRWRRLVAAPALAAAGLATVILTSDTATRGTEIGPFISAPPMARPVVEQPRGVDVAVINTDNPDIVVVWFF